MMQRLKYLCTKVLKDLDATKLTHELLLQKLQPLFEASKALSLDDLGLYRPLASDSNTVGYIPMIEDESFSVGIFVLPPGVRIPLHDHPGMCVVSRLLYGKLRVTSLDWETEGSVMDGKWLGGHARVVQSRWITAPDSQILTPKYGNIHEFRASSEHECAILDIIAPNYDEEADRPCTYYDFVSLTNKDSEIHTISPNKDTPEEHTIQTLSVGDRVFLSPVPQPADFSVTALSLQGPED